MRAPKQKTSVVSRRAAMLLGIQTLVVGGLGLRMRQLQVVEADKYRLLAEENRINIQLIPPARGVIMDRNGRPLAVNQQNYKVTITREQTDDPAAVLADLARLIPLPKERQAELLEQMNPRNTAAFVPLAVAEHLTWEQIARVAANAPVLPGIKPEVGLTRSYPEHETMAHVVGYVGPVNERDLEGPDTDPLLEIPDFQIGKTGIERQVEADLRGQAGSARIEVNSRGRIMRELDRVDSLSGQDLFLTIDTDIQQFAIERMADNSASTVVIDIQTGDILASASTPSFDPNLFVLRISTTDWNALLNDPYRPLSSKAVSGAYPPGSTFKMVVALAAMEAGVVGPQETVYCPGHYDLGNRRFHCWRRGGHGKIDLNDSLKQSCDVYYYEIAQRIGIDKISEMAKRLGLGVRPDIPLPALSPGLMPDRAWKERSYDESWLIGDTLNAGIGQGFLLASPLQLAVMSARIASGQIVKPRLIRAINGKPVAVEPPQSIGISQSSLNAVRQGMDDVVNNTRGTGFRSRILDPEGRMAGKTGTSQVRIITTEERAKGVFRNEDLPWERRDHALFVSFAPYDNPKYAVAVIVEHGGGGSTAAAPIARDVMLRCLYGPTPPLSAYPTEERNRIEQERQAAPPAETGTPTTSSDRDRA